MRSSESGKALYCCMFTPSMSNKTACVFCRTSLCRLKTKMKKKATAVSNFVFFVFLLPHQPNQVDYCFWTFIYAKSVGVLLLNYFLFVILLRYFYTLFSYTLLFPFDTL